MLLTGPDCRHHTPKRTRKVRPERKLRDIRCHRPSCADTVATDTMKLAMLLIALLSLATTVAGVCEDKNLPNDPEFCQSEVGTTLQKILNCYTEPMNIVCFKSCAYCVDTDSRF